MCHILMKGFLKTRLFGAVSFSLGLLRKVFIRCKDVSNTFQPWLSFLSNK